MLRESLLRELQALLGGDGVLHRKEETLVYCCDAYTVEKGVPDAVVFPRSTEQVSQVVKICNRERIPFVPRGAGTSLSGGTIPVEGGVVIELSRMNRILEVDVENQRVVVEPGVVNNWVSEAVAHYGYFYAPDPSSQPTCTIGGNIAHNSGGAHTLKYGVTANHVLGLTVVLPTGDVVELGGKAVDPVGYDLTALMTGAEGTLGVVTKAVLRVIKMPTAVKTFLADFTSVEDATKTVSDIMAAGILPVAVEMMDNPAIRAVEASIHAAGYPQDAPALLLIELDGDPREVEAQAENVVKICGENHVRQVREARSEEERARLWKGRKGAFGAMGRLSPSYLVLDGVIPRTRLPYVLKRVEEVASKYGVQIANVFHAGDGNLHPLIPYDGRVPGEAEKALQAGIEVLKVCVEVGGTITGEHGIGVEKRDVVGLVYSEDDLRVMAKIKHVFDPNLLSNPGKVLPYKATRSEEAPQIPAA